MLLVPCILNWLACAAFLAVRPAGISLLDEREMMRREPGVFFANSADPIMFIADRPLYQWNKWHGGEAAWVKVVEALNWPALVGAKALGGVWSAYAVPRHLGSFRSDSWVVAWLYVLLSSVQWLIIAAMVARVVWRRRTVPAPTAAPTAHLHNDVH
jgi:hypothetical protein